MFTQEKQDLKDRLNALPTDDRNEIIASLAIVEPTSVVNPNRGSKQFKGNRLTWEKFNTFLLLVYGGAILGAACAGVRGAAVGAAIAVLYSWYIFNNKENHSQSSERSC